MASLMPSLVMTKWNDLVDSIKDRAGWQRLVVAGRRQWGVPVAEWRQALAKAAPMSFDLAPPTRREANRLRHLLDWLAQGHPIELWVGEALFYGRFFAVRSGVLLPRTDTEWVVDRAVKGLRHGPWHTVLELGSGSGVMGLTIALECPHVQVIAWEVSRRAVQLTRVNHRRHPCDNHDLRHGSFFSTRTGAPTLLGPHTLMVCNPPYIPTGDLAQLTHSVKTHDPRKALDGGLDGLSFYRRLMGLVKRYRVPLLAEIGWHQAGDMQRLATQRGLMASVYPDVSGRDRIVVVHPLDQNIQI